MKDALEKLKEFHLVFNCARQDKPGLTDDKTAVLRCALINEELRELSEAIDADDLVEIADALADLCYVVIGTAVAYGIPLDKVFEEVHRSNMKKAVLCEACGGAKLVSPAGPVCIRCSGTGLGVKYREDGKVLKPEGWTPPDIKGVLGL